MTEIPILELTLLCIAAFLAGFVDAIAGGGGLIQTPASLVILSGQPVASVLATVKVPSFSGTAFATAQFIRKVKLHWQLAAVICTVAFFSSYAGSQLLTMVSNDFMKPVLLVILVIVAVYTFMKKDLGQQIQKDISYRTKLVRSIILSALLGFYDGFIGPGTGSFLILAMIALLGFDFLQASAHAKVVNLATNLGSITLFMIRGKILWAYALPMAASNALGGYLGAKLAIKKGNQFIRLLFLFIVSLTLLRFFYDVVIR